MPRSQCLSDDELRRYVEGRLDESALDEAAGHLDHCPRCEAAARRLEADANTLLDLLRQPPENSGPHRPDGPDAPPGRVGDHELLGLLGEGGMGVVYRARHLKLGRVVALKMLRGAALAGAEERHRFLVEAEAIARLQHPNIVQVFEVGEDRSAAGYPQPYFTLEYVEGGSLAEHLDNRPQPPARAAAWLEAIARAVHHAHQQGIVHRDLKPSNVLLTADGRVKVCDFGVAKLLAGAAARTRTGALIGTPEFMAPEQGQTAGGPEVGPATDVYALGAILYAALTGHPPFQGASPVETLLLAQGGEPVAPRRLQPGVPRDLETVCLKCLEKAPAARYPTAEALADDLRRFQNGEPVRARRTTAVGRAWRWCRRYPALAAALLAVLLAVLGGTAVSWWFALRANDEAARAGEAARRANERAYASDLRLAQRAWEDDLPDRVRELLDAQLPEYTGGADLRGFEWHYWWRRAHWGLQELRHPGATYGVAYAPDGDRLAAACEDGAVRVWDGRGDLRLTLTGHVGRVYAVAFGPGGDRLASAGADRTVRVWDARAGGPALLTLTGHEHHARGVAFSPDGTRIASAGRDGTVRVWDARRGGPALFTFREHAGPVFGVAFSPDGRRIASSGEDGAVKVWDAAGGGSALTLRGAEHGVYAVCFSPDGGRVAGAGADGTVLVWDANGGGPLVVQRHNAPVWGLAFSPDGDRLASAGQDKLVKVWNAHKAGSALLTLKGHAHVIWGLAYRPDGARIASAGEDAAVRVWDAHTDGETPPLVGHESEITCVALSPDGRRLASAGGNWDGAASRYINGELKVWDLDAGRALLDLKGHASGVTCATFSPDGKVLASAGEVGDEAKKGPVGQVKLWDAETGTELADWRDHDRAVLTLAFSPDGRLLASGGFVGVVRLRKVPTGRAVLTLEGHTAAVTGVAFSPDGRRLASTGSDKEARVWDVRTGAVVHTLPLGGLASGVAFSRDGRRLAVAGYDRRMTVWDAATGQLVLVLKGHTEGATSVAFSPDGTRLAAGGDDHTVRLWETKTGQELLVLKGHTAVVRSVAFSPDGTRLVSGSWDRTVRLWDARPPRAPGGD